MQVFLVCHTGNTYTRNKFDLEYSDHIFQNLSGNISTSIPISILSFIYMEDKILLIFLNLKGCKKLGCIPDPQGFGDS